jgi:hypothetical protein
MAKRFVRIGSMDNIHIYDDADFDGGIETDDVLKSQSAPVNPEDVLRLDDVGDLVGSVVGPATSTDRAVARWVGADGDELDDSDVIISDAGDITTPGDIEGDDITANEIIFIKNIKSGATQAGAGAAADEVWKTSGHASLPDNVLMIGV